MNKQKFRIGDWVEVKNGKFKGTIGRVSNCESFVTARWPSRRLNKRKTYSLSDLKNPSVEVRGSKVIFGFRSHDLKVVPFNIAWTLSQTLQELQRAKFDFQDKLKTINAHFDARGCYFYTDKNAIDLVLEVKSNAKDFHGFLKDIPFSIDLVRFADRVIQIKNDGKRKVLKSRQGHRECDANWAKWDEIIK